jgi:hypothetical protein
MDNFVSRKLQFANDKTGETTTIDLSIGKPYKVAKSDGLEHLSACLVRYDSLEGVGHEVFGNDEMQALGTALVAADTYLSALSQNGRLSWPDGKLYSVRED